MIPPSQQQWLQVPLNELHAAASIGSAQRVMAVLSSKGSINIDHRGPRGWTPRMAAALGGHSRVTEILLGRGASVSVVAGGDYTALHISAHEGHLVVTVQLIKAGADQDARDCQGVTPLHKAAQRGHSTVMAALIDAGADVDCRADDGRTPLFEAASAGRLDAVKALLRAKANPRLP